MKSKSRFTKIAVATGLVVTSGAAVLGLTGFASAQQAHRDVVSVAQVADNNTDATATDTQASNGGVSSQATETATADPANRPNPVAIAAKALGMTEAELVTELKAGKSVADVAKEKGVDLADVKKALLADFKAHLDEEVKSGEHTQAEADAKYAEMSTRIDTMLTTAGLPQGPGGHGGPEGRGGHGGPEGRGPRFASDAVAKALNLSATELQTQLKSGKTLADIAKAQNVDIADVKAAIVSDFKAHLDEEVKSGEHTQAEVDAKLAEFKTHLDDMVNGVRPAGGPMGERHHGDMGAPQAQGQATPQAQGTSFNA